MSTVLRTVSIQLPYLRIWILKRNVPVSCKHFSKLNTNIVETQDHSTW